MEMNVKFYFEPYKNRNAGYLRRHTLLADRYCHSIDEVKIYIIGMVAAARLKQKRFCIRAEDAETGKELHSCVNYE